MTTFAVSLPVKAGDVLALDNADSALMFDTSTPTPIAAYYQLPSLADGQTAAPNNTRAGYRLLLSATVQAAGTTTTSTTSSTGPPVVSHVAQTHRRWREGTKLAKITRPGKPPNGTTFSFALNESARVTFMFEQQLTGRRVNGKCVASNHPSHPACKRMVLRGSLGFTGHTGYQQRLLRRARLADREAATGQLLADDHRDQHRGGRGPEGASVHDRQAVDRVGGRRA